MVDGKVDQPSDAGRGNHQQYYDHGYSVHLLSSVYVISINLVKVFKVSGKEGLSDSIFRVET